MAANAPADWKNFEDFAAGIDTNRLPRTVELKSRNFDIRLDNGRSFSLAFVNGDTVSVTEGGVEARERYEAVRVAEDVYFIDITFAARPTEAETLIVNTATRRVLSVRCRIRAASEAPGEPRVAQDWVPGILAGGTPTGVVPHETRDLIGLRALYTYSPQHVYEHIYLSSARYGWQNLVGVQRGHGDTDMATTFKFGENQYVFGFREFIIPVASVFFYNWSDMRSTGKLLGETGDGKVKNSPGGAFIEKQSMTYYSKEIEPV